MACVARYATLFEQKVPKVTPICKTQKTPGEVCLQPGKGNTSMSIHGTFLETEQLNISKFIGRRGLSFCRPDIWFKSTLYRTINSRKRNVSMHR